MRKNAHPAEYLWSLSANDRRRVLYLAKLYMDTRHIVTNAIENEDDIEFTALYSATPTLGELSKLAWKEMWQLTAALSKGARKKVRDAFGDLTLASEVKQ